MQYREVPKTGERLSALGLGCMRFPTIDHDPSLIDKDKAKALIQVAIDNGINYLDTAYPYHGTGIMEPGQSEPFLAEVLTPEQREQINIATKLPSWLIKQENDMDMYLNHQLERLQMECIDYYLLHTLNRQLWTNLKDVNVTAFLDRAMKNNKIRNAGFSFHDNSVELFKEIIDAYDWSFCQIQYNYLDQNYQAGKEGLNYAASKGLAIIIMEPLKGGSLAANLPSEAMHLFKEENMQRSPAEWSLRWLWDHPEITTVLSGMNHMSQLMENINTAHSTHPNGLTDREHTTIRKVKHILQNKVKVGCTGCGYCMPCPVGVDIPLNFSYLNTFHRFDDRTTQQNTKIMYYVTLSDQEKATNCKECGKCEGHCPQHIPIREKLKTVTQSLSMIL
ncbi:aldo/keto reductase [Puteibacter caeruleilacunae]|nr:aldo/keto reductase [Puteibacter caeruleilacunae]